jgi:predicted secreted hydrolase
MTGRKLDFIARHKTALAAGLGLAGLLAASAPWIHDRLAGDGQAAAPRPPPAAWLETLAERFPETESRPPAFPADHGAHPEAPAELWDFAGIAVDEAGRSYGFRLSFARLGLSPEAPNRPSAWAASAVYRGVFALADAAAGRFQGHERHARAALGMSGYAPETGRLWLDGWTATVPTGSAGGFALKAGVDGAMVDLRLESRKSPVRPDPAGLPGGRLQGYVLSRLDLAGTVAVDGTPRPVTGSGWLSRSWGRLLPPGGPVALNRFQLQLDDGRDLLIVEMRRRDGSAEPLAGGLVVAPDGRATALPRHDLHLEPAGFWTSSATGRRYPVAWRVALAGAELDLAPLVEDQEIGGLLPAWSGTVRVRGRDAQGRPLSGVGFVDVAG